MVTDNRTGAQIQNERDALVQSWLAEYGAPEVVLGEVLCDRHADDPACVALRYEDATGQQRTYTFAEMRDLSARFAGVLKSLGVARGDRVATLLPKSPELMVATLALWRIGAAHVPLFTAFGPEAVAYRLAHSQAKVLVTDGPNRPKIEPETAAQRVITVQTPTGGPEAGDLSFWPSLEAAPAVSAVTVSGDDLMILIYTSGTTGQPKGVEVPVRALASFAGYMHFGLDLREDDVYWNNADPGWAYGLYFALVAPLLLGHATLFVNARFDALATWQAMCRYGVTNFATAPTVYRAMRAAGLGAIKSDPTPPLRVATSGGEPLNPDVIAWGEEALGITIHDHYGQTEIGMAICNQHAPDVSQPVRLGSMGHPLTGMRATIVDDAGNELEPGREGQIAIDVTRSPFYAFRGYYRDAARTAERFAGGRYYLTGDAASRDADGYFYFSSRTDDIITSSGYRIGPFEVESALMGHAAVAEAAVVGVSDELRGEVVKAFIVLRPGFAATDDLEVELGQFVKVRLAAHAYPREVAFVDQLPRTPSGKVQRFLLKEQSFRARPR